MSEILSGKFVGCNNIEVFYDIYVPENPVAVLQFAHGMAEHKARYAEFGNWLAERGIVFAINDHAGHGASTTKEDMGYFGDGGWRNLVADAKSLSVILKDKFPNLPFFMGGHSMGSFVARAYISEVPGIAGAVIIGTGNADMLVSSGKFIAKIVAKSKGDRYQSKTLDNLSFGSYNKRIPDAKTKFDWLTTDAKIVEEYIKDEKCGFITTARGFADITAMICHVSSKKCTAAVKDGLPVLIMTGEHDPVGKYGADADKLAKMLSQAKVTVKHYDARHEVLNETCKANAFGDILAFIEANK